jgi:hypothetical protein
MKTNKITHWTAACAAVLTSTAAFSGLADQTSTAAQPEKDYTGTVVGVDSQEHMFSVKGSVFSEKTFNLGGNCAYLWLGNNNGAADGLRPGEKVAVRYQAVHGVLIADRIEQHPMRFEGMITTISPDKHTLTLDRHGRNKDLQIADGCNVVLRDNAAGTFADLHPGNHVVVTYETPNDTPTAREIAQTSVDFTGRLTAIDLDERIVKAEAGFETKKFNVADNCAVVINGQTGGKLSDLKPNENLVLSYDEINGVNVVNRIAPATSEGQKNNNVVDTTRPGYPGMGY